MKKIFAFFIMMPLIGFAQNKFSVSKDAGLTKSIVVEIPEKSASDIYAKSLEWIMKNYKNPDEVILAKIESDYIRFEGFAPGLFCFSALGSKNCNDVKYQMELAFKDGKYRLEIVSLADFMKASQFNSAGWRSVGDLSTFASPCFKSSGEVKPMCKDYVVDVPNYFNRLSDGLTAYLKGNDSNNDW